MGVRQTKVPEIITLADLTNKRCVGKELEGLSSSRSTSVGSTQGQPLSSPSLTPRCGPARTPVFAVTPRGNLGGLPPPMASPSSAPLWQQQSASLSPAPTLRHSPSSPLVRPPNSHYLASSPRQSSTAVVPRIQRMSSQVVLPTVTFGVDAPPCPCRISHSMIVTSVYHILTNC